MDKTKMLAYQHIQKSMLSSKQTLEESIAIIIKKEGPYYLVTRDTNKISDTLTWSIHESNVLAIFNNTHNIWKLLYL